MRGHRRSGPIRPNRDRRAAATERNFGARGDEIRARPCHVAGMLEDSPCSGPTECAHDPSRGAGGDRRSMGPLCRGHHLEHGQGRESFDAKYGGGANWLRGEWETIARQLEDLGVDLPDGWEDTEQSTPDELRASRYAARTYGYKCEEIGLSVDGFGSQRDARADAWERWHARNER